MTLLVAGDRPFLSALQGRIHSSPGDSNLDSPNAVREYRCAWSAAWSLLNRPMTSAVRPELGEREHGPIAEVVVLRLSAGFRVQFQWASSGASRGRLHFSPGKMRLEPSPVHETAGPTSAKPQRATSARAVGIEAADNAGDREHVARSDRTENSGNRGCFMGVA